MPNGQTKPPFDPSAPYEAIGATQQDSGKPAFDPSAPYAPVPANGQQPASQAPPAPTGDSWLQRAVNTIPGVGLVHQGAAAVQDWANNELSPANPHMLSPAATFGVGVLRDVAGLDRSVTTPGGLATGTALATVPEVAGPVLAAHGVYSGVKGWGDLRNPDVLQNELNAAAEIVGGGAATGEAVGSPGARGGPLARQVQSTLADRAAAAAPDAAFNNFQRSMPATKSAPYTRADYDAARSYLENEHAETNIDGVEGARDAADASIGKIEDAVSARIAKAPGLQITTNPLADARAALSQSPRGQQFVDSGLKDLDGLGLDQPLTVADADKVRLQLNQENRAVLKKNNYDVASARATDPGFAAREAAAESLRNGIYGNFPDLQGLRLDEGSLIKVRNAAQNQIFNGEKQVGGTAPGGAISRAINRAAGIAGGSLGYGVGGPVGGAVGAEGASVAAEALSPKNLTRNELAVKSFDQPVTNGQTRLSAVTRNTGAMPQPITGTQPPLFTQQGPLFETSQTPAPSEAGVPTPRLPGGVKIGNPYNEGTNAVTIPALKEGKEIGSITLTPESTGHMRVSLSAVESPYQSQGIASQLYREAQSYAQGHGYKGITSDWRYGTDPAAQRIWKFLGAKTTEAPNGEEMYVLGSR